MKIHLCEILFFPFPYRGSTFLKGGITIPKVKHFGSVSLLTHIPKLVSANINAFDKANVLSPLEKGFKIVVK